MHPLRRPKLHVQALVVTVLLFSLGVIPAAASTKDCLVTVGPLADYRSSAAVDYAAFHLAGPIVKWERKATERELALRPLFTTTRAGERDAVLTDVLFPLFRYRRDREVSQWNLLSIVHYESQNYRERQRSEYKLFPLFEYGHGDGRPTSFALFPLAAHVYNWFGREETEFLLFPLWSRTRHRDGTRIDNVLWPFFARIHGDDPQERGFKAWPLVGRAARPGNYEKFFLFWPLWMANDTGLDSDNPQHQRYVFPFWLYSESPRRSERTLLWPLFSRIEQRGQNAYREINAPWPLVMFASGDYRHGTRVLPFYGDVTTGTSRTVWYGWPIYRFQSKEYTTVIRRTHSLLYLLYTDLKEQVKEDQSIRLQRRLLWPLFGYRHANGVSHFYTLALLEPLFPESDGIERNWSPLWRLYQSKWDTQGNRVSSILWNLYWRETGPGGTAWEVFPLFSYMDEPGKRFRWSILKGLISFKKTENTGSRLHLLFLPWGIPLGSTGTAD